MKTLFEMELEKLGIAKQKDLESRGTPRDIRDAIAVFICTANSANGAQPVEQGFAIIRDFLAQRFGAAMLKTHTSEQEAMLEELWFSITGEKMGEKK